MADKILVFYGSYRSDRVGIRMADFVVAELAARGAQAELVDAKQVGLPIIDRMYKEYPPGAAPPAMEALAKKIRAADAFVFVVGEYNWGPQPGLKNLTDHFLEEWYWRPAAVVTYSPGRLSGARAGSSWHPILSEMGMIVISSTLAVGPIAQTFDEQGQPIGQVGEVVRKTFDRVADDLAWWAAAARAQREKQAPPY
jgi:NAD(P)H-dependent FMN reductase